MPAWTMPGTTVRATLLAEARAVSPRDFGSADRPAEDLHAQAAIFELAEATIAHWNRGIHLATSTGSWADQHARDRDEARQAGERDESLVARLRTPPAAVTATAIADSVNNVLTAAGVSGSALLVRVPRDAGAFLGSGSSIRSFASRGDRAWLTGRGHLVVIVPEDTTASDVAAVARVTEAKSTAGSSSHVEITTTT